MEKYQAVDIIRASFPLACILAALWISLVKPDSTIIQQTLLTMGATAHQSADTKKKEV